MIYGITGLPGNGKTLYALHWVKQKAEKEGRPVFYAGIKDLKLPWTEVDPLKWFECPPNAIVVIDECQRYFGVRPRGQKPPPHAEQLETHRHLGIDLVLITQSPMLLDNHDRSLIATHFHVVRNFGLARATVYEFQQCRDNVLKSRTGGIRHEWAYPKEAYGWYTSAEVHTHKARIPARVWILLALPLVLGLIIWFMVVRWEKKIKGEDLPTSTPATLTAGYVHQSNTGGKAQPLTKAEYVASYQPRVEGLAYTAPVYDEVTKPQQAPYPAACIQSKTRCQCYTQQGTRLDVPTPLCEGITAGGFFVAWDKPVVQAVRMERPAPPAEPAPGYVSLGGVKPAAVVSQADDDPQPRRSGKRSAGS